MDLNKLHCFYSDHVTSNQKTQIDKTCWRDLASLPYHIVYKDLQFMSVNFFHQIKALKKYEKCFLFHLKSFFRNQAFTSLLTISLFPMPVIAREETRT